MCSRVMPSQSRSRSPEASLNDCPVSWTLVPGAWLMIEQPRGGGDVQHRARSEW